MAKQKQEEPKKHIIEPKQKNYEPIFDMAKKLGLRKENVEMGIKENPSKTNEAIEKAYIYKFKRK